MEKSKTGGLDDIALKLESIPEKIQTKLTKIILKNALVKVKAREDLKSYIKSHFKAHTGIYHKSVSTIKTTKLKNDKNRIISYIYFLPLNKIKAPKKGKGGSGTHMEPKTLTNWFNEGTRAHAIGKGSRLKTKRELEHLGENRLKIIINRAKLNLLKSKTEKQKAKYQSQITRNTERLAELIKRRNRPAIQRGKVVKGITAHHFMEKIQQNVDSKAVAIVLDMVQESVTDLMKQ